MNKKNQKQCCYECNEELTEAESYRVPTDSGSVRGRQVKPRGRDRFEIIADYHVWNNLCYGCFIAYSGFDNEGRPAVVQLLEA